MTRIDLPQKPRLSIQSESGIQLASGHCFGAHDGGPKR